MSTSLLDEPAAQAVRPSISPAQRLRTQTAAVRLAISWLGVRKTLTNDQKNQAAESFGAEGNFLSAGKKLLDTTHPKFKAVTTVKSNAVKFWKSLSLPYPEAGLRLIRQNKIEMFDGQMREFQQELDEAVEGLEEHYHHLKATAQRRLGSLFDPADYPATLTGLFALEWDFPSVEPPNYLQQLNPEIYQQECERVQQRFDQAVQLAEQAFTDELAEQAFTDELSKLVAHLLERLTGQVDGKPKVFRNSAVENLVEFFDRFKQLNIRSNDDLDELVGQCQQIVEGRDPQELRDNHVLRQSVAHELGEVQNVLDDLLVDRPRRNILRRPR